jgi:hypothetical protein
MHLSSVSHLSWLHVGFALTSLAFISAVSQLLRLHIGAPIAIAALCCIAQLTIMGILLRHVLVMKKLWAVAEITCTFFPPHPGSHCRGALSRLVLTFPSVSDHPQYGRNWCVLPIGRCNPSHVVVTWPKVVVKATRRFRHMVSVCASSGALVPPLPSVKAGRGRCLLLSKITCDSLLPFSSFPQFSWPCLYPPSLYQF